MRTSEAILKEAEDCIHDGQPENVTRLILEVLLDIRERLTGHE
jgi:hypothetical protein